MQTISKYNTENKNVVNLCTSVCSSAVQFRQDISTPLEPLGAVFQRIFSPLLTKLNWVD